MKEQSNKDFYIGYLPKAPQSFARNNRLFVIIVAIVLPLLGFLLVQNQQGYRDSTFELGQLTTVTGILIKEPVPMLKVPLGGPEGKQYQSVLLIGFGKKGALPTLEQIEMAEEVDLNGKMITLEGTLIYYDGKALLELSKKAAAFKAIVGQGDYESDREVLGGVTLKGEIVDPKCYFGVMKPGEGKPHRACAANCIAGGIPATLRTEDEYGQVRYLLLTGLNGESINNFVLPVIGEPIALEGTIERIDDWLYFRSNPEQHLRRLHSHLLNSPPMCSPQLTQR